MDIVESLRTAWRSFMAHRLRTALAILGIVIGVAAVITLLAVGKGQQEVVTSQVQSLGTNLLFIRPGAATTGGRVRLAPGTASTLTYEDAQAIEGEIPQVKQVAPEWWSPAQISISGGRNLNTFVRGVTPAYFDVRNARLNGGQLIEEGDLRARASTAVLGANVAQELFGGEAAIDQSIRINTGRAGNLSARVIGVLAPVGGSGFTSPDESVFVPLTTVLSRVGAQRTSRGVPNVSTINVQIDNQKQMSQAAGAIDQLLRRRHRVTEPDFIIQSQEDILATLRAISDAETILMSSIAGISLLVGGIGIMNIMLVSVTERTREIGIRKALGARRKDILQQFLVEALLVSIFGGTLGVVIGVGLSRAAEGQSISGRFIHTIVTPEAVLISFIVSAAIGVFFGFYPAMRAARLNPVDALRYE